MGVSRRGYIAISKTWLNVLKYYKIKSFGLPRSHNVGKVRNLLNQEIPKKIGKYYHIEGIILYEKGGKKSSFEYNEYNNTWMNIKKAQSFMVRYYSIRGQDYEEKLVFVMKLDEAQIQKCQKMERISISLKNKVAL